MQENLTFNHKEILLLFQQLIPTLCNSYQVSLIMMDCLLVQTHLTFACLSQVCRDLDFPCVPFSYMGTFTKINNNFYYKFKE